MCHTLRHIAIVLIADSPLSTRAKAQNNPKQPKPADSTLTRQDGAMGAGVFDRILA